MASLPSLLAGRGDELLDFRCDEIWLRRSLALSGAGGFVSAGSCFVVLEEDTLCHFEMCSFA